MSDTVSHPPTASSGGPSGRTQGETMALVIASLVVGCAGLYLTRSLVGPAFFALTLVITVRPLVSWAHRHHVPRSVAAVGAIMLIYTFVIGLFAALGMAIAQLVETLPDYSAKFGAIWSQVLALLDRFGWDQTTVLEQIVNSMDTDKIVGVAQAAYDQVTNIGSMLSIMALTVVFLMFDMSRIEMRAEALTILKPGVASALKGFAVSVRSYWLVSTVFGLIVAVLDVVALGILNVPMAVTWGVLSFITNYIPNIGFFVGVIPPALLALVDSGPLTALWVIVAYTVLNFVIQSLIQPKFTGDAVGLNTTTTFLSLLFWSQVIGALGAILAVPLTLFAKAVLIDTDPRSRWISLFLSAGDEPVRRTEQLDAQEVDALDLDGDGIGPADPQYGTPAVALDEAGGAARATTAERPGAAAAEEGKG
ncbi:AI-2E family transporter [Actinomyces oricola]